MKQPTTVETPALYNGQQKCVVDLQWQVEKREECPEDSLIRDWAFAGLVGGSFSQNAELTIRIVDCAEMQRANSRWRGVDKTTNVLSFPADFPPEAGLNYLGDMLLCADVVNMESKLQGKHRQAHWAHIVVHGILHLQGYDHIDDSEAATMECLEIDILASLGLPDPYMDSRVSGQGPTSINEVEQN